MKYLCTNCSFVYDNDLGDREENIGVGEELDLCPVCQEYDTFQGIEEEINYIDDDKLHKMEIDHYPEVEIKNNKIIVTVGSEVHPMGEEHRIASVSLYDEYSDLIETKYLELENESIVEFDFDDLDEFEIRVKCSLHGIWARKILN